MMLTRPGGLVYIEDDYMNQNQNWVGASSAPASLNYDKEIETHFGSVGLEYQFNRAWGISLQIPYWDRILRTDIGTPAAPQVTSYRHGALGDIRVLGRYTGFSPDLSTGISFGLKLATGDWTYPNFDRDTQIGTGTTDLLLGGYHVGDLSGKNHLQWFTEILYDRAFNTRDGYRPGDELDAAIGVMHDGIHFGPNSGLVLLLQLIGSNRLRDSGSEADPYNSGYQRLLISPGVQVNYDSWQLYADAEFRIYNYANAAPNPNKYGTQGQLVAPVLFKVVLSYSW